MAVVVENSIEREQRVDESRDVQRFYNVSDFDLRCRSVNEVSAMVVAVQEDGERWGRGVVFDGFETAGEGEEVVECEGEGREEVGDGLVGIIRLWFGEEEAFLDVVN